MIGGLVIGNFTSIHSSARYRWKTKTLKVDFLSRHGRSDSQGLSKNVFCRQLAANNKNLEIGSNVRALRNRVKLKRRRFGLRSPWN